jgi:hypothetical protein
MTIQKRFIAVFVSPDGGMYHRSAVYDSHNLNGAFVKKGKNRVNSGGQSFTIASDLVNQINDLKNGGYKAISFQYNTWREIPEDFILAKDTSPEA